MNRFLNALRGTHLYPLTDKEISGFSHARQVRELSASGARLIQLREKQLSAREFYEEAAAALHVARERDVKLIINDRVDIALTLRADGVHLGQDDLSPDVARLLLGPEAIIGISTHNLPQALLALRMPVDYVAVGPIFPTGTKTSENKPLGLAGLRKVKRGLGDMPLVAIGGVSEMNSADVLAAGADALAIISNLWVPPTNASERRRNLIQHPPR